MAALRYREEGSRSGDLMVLAAGTVLGLVAGLWLADRVGGFSGLTARLRDRVGEDADADEAYDDEDEFEPDEADDELAALESRVLEAFRNDPILAARAIDISAVEDGVIELSGRVRSEEEVTHAATIARGVPGVEEVDNRIYIRTRRTPRGRDVSGVVVSPVTPAADSARAD